MNVDQYAVNTLGVPEYGTIPLSYQNVVSLLVNAAQRLTFVFSFIDMSTQSHSVEDATTVRHVNPHQTFWNQGKCLLLRVHFHAFPHTHSRSWAMMTQVSWGLTP